MDQTQIPLIPLTQAMECPSSGFRPEPEYAVPANCTFGEIEFVDFPEHIAKFVRVHVETDTSIILKQMTNVWGMQKPNLLISVTGGSNNCNIDPDLGDAFQYELMKAAITTDAWIITGGTNTGVTKLVGEVEEYYGLTSTNPKCAIIGIAQWRVIQNRKALVNEKGSWKVKYRTEEELNGDKSFLDPNHTHFILIDDGIKNVYKTAISFRAELERKISEMEINTGDDRINLESVVSAVPTVLLVLEGGPDTLQTVENALMENTPVVIVKSSGRAADILAFAFKYASDDEDDQDITLMYPALEAEIRKQLKNIVSCSKEEIDDNIKLINNCLARSKLIHICKWYSGSGDLDMEEAILKALLKAKKNQVMDHLGLSLTWDKIDIAKSEIFTDDKVWTTGKLDNIMLLAILKDRVNFVELFLDNGIDLEDFLTIKRLMMLYNNQSQTRKKCFLDSLFEEIWQKKKKVACNMVRPSLRFTISPSKCALFDDLNYNVLDSYKIRLQRNIDVDHASVKYIQHSPSKQCEKRITLEMVGELIQDLLGDYYDSHYISEEKYSKADGHLGKNQCGSCKKQVEKKLADVPQGSIESTPSDSNNDTTEQVCDFDNPQRDLFIWSVLNNQREMAKFFWEEGTDAIAAALVAHALLFAMSRRTDSKELIEQYTENANEFADLAIGVLKECQKSDEHNTHRMLIRKVPEWGQTSCILIAVSAKNERFISQPECQDLFKCIWKGQLTQTNGTLRLLICTVIPPLIPLLVTFKEKEDGKQSSDNNGATSCEQQTQKSEQQSLRCKSNPNLNPSHCSQEAPENKDDSVRNTKVDAKRLGLVEKFTSFYRAPVVVFCHNVITYMAFLCLYSYILICQFDENPSLMEYILIVWVFTLVSEEFRQVYKAASKTLKTKFRSYISDGWNKLDVITILMFVIGISLRFIRQPLTLEAARIVLGVDLVMYYLKMLHIFRVHKELGPKLMLIIRAAQSLAYFFVIILIFVVAYAVASHGILYPNAELNLDTLIAIFRRPYRNIYGELMLEEIEDIEGHENIYDLNKTEVAIFLEGDVDCTNDGDLYRNGTYSRCPTASGKYFVPVLMGFYMLICNILLINLLIVVFTGVFGNEEYKTNLYWNLQLNNLIDEYGNRSILAPPFSAIERVFQLIIFIVRKCFMPCQPNSSAPRGGPFLNDLADMSESEQSELLEWEDDITHMFHYNKKQADEDDTDHNVKSTAPQFEQLEKKIIKMQKQQQASTERMFESMERQLRWIMDSLREHNLGSSRDIPEVYLEHD